MHFYCCLGNLDTYASSFSSWLSSDGGDLRFCVVFLWDLAGSQNSLIRAADVGCQAQYATQFAYSDGIGSVIEV